MEVTVQAGKPAVDREKTAPFLIRTFVKVGGFHRLALFEDSTLPTTDEQQLFTWKDATLREVLTTLRIAAPHVAEFRHPLARFSFRALYADSGNRGHFAQKELGLVYSRDVLGEPGNLETAAIRLLEDFDGEKREATEREKEERTLEELRFVPGDYLCVAILLPKSISTGDPPAKGPANGATNGWRNGPTSAKIGSGWPESSAPVGRGGGHWRGASDVPAGGRGRGGRGDPPRKDIDRRDRDFDRERRIPPRRSRESPPPFRSSRVSPPRRVGRGRGRDRRSRSRTNSPSPPRKRGGRY